MDAVSAASWIDVLLQIVFLDLLLGGDNTLMIALACQGLPSRDAPKAIVLGTAGAILFRVVLTAVARLLIALPYLKLVSAFLLIVIAIKICSQKHTEAEAAEPVAGSETRSGIWAAAVVIIVADTIMSLDNIVAVAAVAQGNVWFIAAGLALSIPLLIYGAFILTEVVRAFPILFSLGGALLGWIAGDLAITDPLVADWATKQAPALAYVLPLVCAVFVLLESRSPCTTSAIDGARRAKVRSVHARPAAVMRRSAVPRQRAAEAVRPKSELRGTAAIEAFEPRLKDLAAPPAESRKDDHWVLYGLIGLFLAWFIVYVAYIRD